MNSLARQGLLIAGMLVMLAAAVPLWWPGTATTFETADMAIGPGAPTGGSRVSSQRPWGIFTYLTEVQRRDGYHAPWEHELEWHPGPLILTALGTACLVGVAMSLGRQCLANRPARKTPA
jgi:hypothetical protein